MGDPKTFECGLRHLQFNPEGDPDRGIYSIVDPDDMPGKGTPVTCPQAFASRRDMTDHMLCAHSHGDLIHHILAVRDGRVDAWGREPGVPEWTEAKADDAIAASYLADITHIADQDKRMYRFACTKATEAKQQEYRTETDRAEAVGEKVKHAFAKYLSPAQQEDPTGHLFAKFLAHVSTADLGFYYLEQTKGK